MRAVVLFPVALLSLVVMLAIVGPIFIISQVLIGAGWVTEAVGEWLDHFNIKVLHAFNWWGDVLRGKEER